MSAGESKGISTSPWTATSPRPATPLEDSPPSHSPSSAPQFPLATNLRLNVYGVCRQPGHNVRSWPNKIKNKFWFYFYTHSIVSSPPSLSLSPHTHTMFIASHFTFFCIDIVVSRRPGSSQAIQCQSNHQT